MASEIVLTKIDKYTNIFINEKKSLNCSENTITTYSHILNSFYEYILEFDTLNNILDIDKEFLLSFLNKDENISSSTKILRLRVMKSFFSFIDEIEGLNSLFEIRFKKLSIKAKVKEVEALNSDEVKRLLALFEKKTNSFNKNRDALLIKLIIFTGIRASECLNLQLSDFFVIDVDGVSVYKILIYGKGNKERYVYIKVDKIQKELEFLTVNNYIVNYIAVTSSKKKMTRVGLYNMISNKMKKALIKKKGVHILRHTFARDLVAKNINLQTISELLGHASIILTAKTYARSNEGSKIRAII
jgi:integrase/recombinase XerD